MSKKEATNICLLSCLENSAVYQEVLLMPFLRERLPIGKFQQDNTPCHTSKATRRFFKANKIKVLKTAPESPDLNLIDNLWHQMKHFIQTTNPETKRKSCKASSHSRSTLTPERCYRYIEHLKKVMPTVIEVRGEGTGYSVYFCTMPVLFISSLLLCAIKKAGMMVKLHAQEVRLHPRFSSDVSYEQRDLDVYYINTDNESRKDMY